jgi:hypothetical protein
MGLRMEIATDDDYLLVIIILPLNSCSAPTKTFNRLQVKFDFYFPLSYNEKVAGYKTGNILPMAWAGLFYPRDNYNT